VFTDYYAEASCTQVRANFITGELPIRTGMTTVGQPRQDRNRGSGDHRAVLKSMAMRRAIRQESPWRSQ